MQAHSTDEQASVAVAIAVEFALQAGAFSLSLSLCLVLVAVTVGCSPLPLPLRSRTKAAAMHFLPNARIRIPYNVVLRSATDSLPESLTAWLTGWRSGGLLRNAKQHTMQPRGKHNTQSDFYIKTASASPAWLRWWCVVLAAVALLPL